MIDERFDGKWKVDLPSGCHLWTKYVRPDGYASFSVGRKRFYAHRWSYQRTYGTISDGMVLDHLCRVRHCVNPDHLEPVTNRDNIERGIGNVNKSHCLRGHKFTEENTRRERNGSRSCRTCRNKALVEYRARKSSSLII